MRYLNILFSAIGGGLVVYGFEHERMWYIVGLAFITGTIRLLWRNKSDVTHKALCAVAKYLLDGEKEFGFQYKGECYVMKIERREE